MNLTYTYHHWI